MNTVHIHLPLDHVPLIWTFLGMALVSRAISPGSSEVSRTARGLFVMIRA